MAAANSPSSFLDDVQRATPDMDVAATLDRAGYTSVDEVRADLARLGHDQADIDHVVPPNLSVF